MNTIKLLFSLAAAICCVLLGYWLAQDKPLPKYTPESTAKIRTPEIPVLREPLLPIVLYTPWPRPTNIGVTTSKDASLWISHFLDCNLRGFILARRQNGESVAIVSHELLFKGLQPELFKKLKWQKYHNGATAIAKVDSNPVNSQGFPLVGKLEEGKELKVMTAFFTITSEPAIATWNVMARPTKFPNSYSFEADAENAILLSNKLVGTGVYDEQNRIVGIITKSAVAIQEGMETAPIFIQVEPIPE